MPMLISMYMYVYANRLEAAEGARKDLESKHAKITAQYKQLQVPHITALFIPG